MTDSLDFAGEHYELIAALYEFQTVHREAGYDVAMVDGARDLIVNVFHREHMTNPVNLIVNWVARDEVHMDCYETPSGVLSKLDDLVEAAHKPKEIS